MRINRIAGLTAVIGLGLAAAAAGAQVASLQLSPARVSATAGDTVQFTLIAKDSAGRTITAPSPLWLVGPFEIAAVSQTGLARTFRQGEARVMVRVAGKMAQAVGQRRRAVLAAALVGHPETLLLDEPLETLDRSMRELLLGWLGGRINDGATVVVSTHEIEPFLDQATGIVTVVSGVVRWVGLPSDAVARRRIAEAACRPGQA